jgi:hypothetical protein
MSDPLNLNDKKPLNRQKVAAKFEYMEKQVSPIIPTEASNE